MELLKAITGFIAALASFLGVCIQIYKIWQDKFHPKGKKRTHRNKENVYFWVSLVIAIISLVTYLLLTIINPCTDPTKYGFEKGEMGWVPQTYIDSQGVTNALRSTEQAKICKHSLRFTVDLDGAHPNKAKGEVFVEVPFQNLENKPISVWIYIPKDAVGDQNKPNGVQIFVKDKDLHGEYGVWWDITPGQVDSWQQVTLTPSSSPPTNVYMEPEFDPTQIRIIGVKIAIGDGSTDKYQGSIYIDGIDWP